MDQGFCGDDVFWDANLTWNTNSTPEFTRCFERTALVYFPCAYFWLFCWVEVRRLARSKDRLIPWSAYNGFKLLCSGLVLLAQVLDFAAFVSAEAAPTSDVVAPIVLFFTILMQTIFVIFEKRRGIQSSGFLHIFWTLLMLCSIPQYVHDFNLNEDKTIEELAFVAYNIYFPLTIVMFLLFCFADVTPKVTHVERTPKSSPFLDASFLSKITFFWMEKMVWRGWKNPLEQSDMYDLVEENTSVEVVKKWDANFQKTLQKAKSKNPNVKNPEVSVFPTILRTFGMEFMIGTFQKFIYDLLSFVSPIIMSKLIAFTQDESQPIWKGYYYALILFMSSILMSILLGQYSIRMYMIGVKIRTAITSTVYRKALKISSSARKNRTVGEIVNLMAVDAQRFMDLTVYLNTVFSAPLVIIVCLYGLWQLLGPSSMAGLVTIIVLIPINGFVTSFSRRFQVQQMKEKDERVKIMNEIFNGMKVLKLYAWESSFEDKVLGIRSKEITQLKMINYLSAVANALFNLTPFLIQFTMFLTYVLVSDQNILTEDKVFVSISLMNLLRMPMFMLPFLLVSIVQASVSLNRLNVFINGEELDPNNVIYDANHSAAIEITEGTFAWDGAEAERNTLCDVTLRVSPGALVAVVGTVGAGKSSLCGAMLGDLHKVKGQVKVKSSVSYAAQQAWIQNSTLKDNITFGKEMDQSRYDEVIQACALAEDLKILPGGDMTEIGEKGINLSGGQKQRVSLARAVYANSDIFILDDPLSAVDAHVGKHIFEKVVSERGLLAGKTRILVTHSAVFLPRVDHIVVMKDGRISEQGSYQELLDAKGEFQEFLTTFLAEGHEDEYDEEDLDEIKSKLEKSVGKDALRDSITKRKRTLSSASKGSHSSLRRRNTHKGKEAKTEAKPEAAPVTGQKLIEKETSERGNIGWGVYLRYLKSIGLFVFSMSVVMFTIVQACRVCTSLWLKKWSGDPTSAEPDVRNKYLGVYTGLGVAQALFVLMAMFISIKGTIRASSEMHSSLLLNMMRSPMAFFDVTPIGRILNRFSKDIDTIDILLPMNIRSYVQVSLMVLSTIGLIIALLPMFTVVLVPCVIFYYFCQTVYVRTYRQLKRIESVTRSPIYSHFGETVQGASTIRAYSKEEEFIRQSEKRVDINQMSYVPNVVCNRWLSFRLEQIGNLLTTGTIIFAILARKGDTFSPGDMALCISYAQGLTNLLYMLIRFASETESNIVSVERTLEYTRTPREAAWEVEGRRPEKSWPDKGVVEFKNFSTRYREGLDLVVKDINIHIEGGQKVAIVGRTGAGKSSLTLALFRIIEAASGSILIDGLDTGKMGLHDLRKKLAIIPQDPVLFSGSLRSNLDPADTHEDLAVWAALEQAHLKDFVKDLPGGLLADVQEGGENFSVGQRQLVCLARALLRGSRVLVLDEATAAVDLETDELIQATIRQQFARCTVITIAHRLNTIIDNDVVVVMDKGLVSETGAPQALMEDSSSAFHSMARDAGLLQGENGNGKTSGGGPAAEQSSAF